MDNNYSGFDSHSESSRNPDIKEDFSLFLLSKLIHEPIIRALFGNDIELLIEKIGINEKYRTHLNFIVRSFQLMIAPEVERNTGALTLTYKSRIPYGFFLILLNTIPLDFDSEILYAWSFLISETLKSSIYKVKEVSYQMEYRGNIPVGQEYKVIVQIIPIRNNFIL